MEIRQAEKADNVELCRLDSLCTQGRGLVFRYQREDFFIRSRVYDRWKIFLARSGEAVIGVVAVCIKEIRLRGSPQEAGYVYDLRVHPDHRRKGVARALLQKAEEYIREQGAEYGYTYVLGSNQISKVLARRLGMFRAAPFQVFFLAAWPGEAELEPLTEKKGLERIGLEKQQEKYDLIEVKKLPWRFSGEGGPLVGFFKLGENMEITGGLWNSSVLSTKVVDRVPFWFRLLGLLPDRGKKALKLPVLPRPGQILPLYHIFDIGGTEKDPKKTARLLQDLRTEAANRGATIVMCHLDARDPLVPLVQKQSFFSVRGEILMRTAKRGEDPGTLELAYLDVRDF